VLLLYFLVPLRLWPGLSTLLPNAENWDRIFLYIFLTEVKGIAITLAIVGLYLNKSSVGDLIGAWPRVWRARRTEIYLAGLFALLAILLSVTLSLTFGRFNPEMADLSPHTLEELLLFLLLAVTAGFGEELIFRGYFLKQFQALTGNFIIALLGQAVLFSLAHGYHQTLASMADKFFFGIMFGLLANWRKSGTASRLGDLTGIVTTPRSMAPSSTFSLTLWVKLR